MFTYGDQQRTLAPGCLKEPDGVPIELWNGLAPLYTSRDQSPGHERMFDSPTPESRIRNPKAINPDFIVNKQTNQTNITLIRPFIVLNLSLSVKMILLQSLTNKSKAMPLG